MQLTEIFLSLVDYRSKISSGMRIFDDTKHSLDYGRIERHALFLSIQKNKERRFERACSRSEYYRF